MPDQPSPLNDALTRLLAFRGQHPTGAIIDPLSKLTTADLDVAIESTRMQLPTPPEGIG